MSKIDFLIGTILAIFNLEIILWWPFWISNQQDLSYFSSARQLVAPSLISTEFTLWLARFSRWQLWGQSWIFDPHGFSLFQFGSGPVATSKFGLKLTEGLGRDVKN